MRTRSACSMATHNIPYRDPSLRAARSHTLDPQTLCSPSPSTPSVPSKPLKPKCIAFFFFALQSRLAFAPVFAGYLLPFLEHFPLVVVFGLHRQRRHHPFSGKKNKQTLYVECNSLRQLVTTSLLTRNHGVHLQS